MRVLFVSNVHPLPWQRGRGVFNQRLVTALRAAGHDVDVVVPVNLIEHLRRLPRALTATDDGATYARYVVPPRVLRAQYHRIAWLFLRGALRRQVARARPDVILAFWLHPDAAIAQRLGAEHGIPVVPMAGGSDLLVITRDPARRDAVRRVLAAAPAVLTNGTMLRNAAVALGAAPDRVHAFRRGVDTSRFTPGDRDAARRALRIAPDEKLLLFVGNLVHVKGPDLLVSALAQCGGTAPWRVAWLGDGPMRPALEAAAQDAGIAERMRFVGRVDHAELPAWYRAADLVALPSRSEGIPNVLLEAMACGTPFVAFNVGGVAEIAPDPGMLVPPADVAGLAAALERLWANAPRVDIVPSGDAEMVAQIVTALTHAMNGPTV